MNEDIDIKRKKRSNLKLLIKVYARKKYDARPIIGEYLRLTDELEQAGVKHRTNLPCLTREYWDNPNNRCNQSKITRAVGCVDGMPIHKRIRDIIPEAKQENIKQPDYFKITITVPSNIDGQSIDYIYNYCSQNGLELISTTCNNHWMCILYQTQSEEAIIYPLKTSITEYIQKIGGFVTMDKIT